MTTAHLQSNIVQIVQQIQDKSTLEKLLEVLKGFAEEEDQEVNLTASQKQVLDERIDRYRANPDNVLTWEEVKANLRK